MNSITTAWMIAGGVLLIGIAILTWQTFRQQRILKEPEQELQETKKKLTIRQTVEKKNKKPKIEELTRTLGSLIGFVIAMYVFDTIMGQIVPLATCQDLGKGSFNITNGVCSESNFATSLGFIQNIFPIVAIIGIVAIVKKGLDRAKMI